MLQGYPSTGEPGLKFNLHKSTDSASIKKFRVLQQYLTFSNGISSICEKSRKRNAGDGNDVECFPNMRFQFVEC